MLCAAGGIRIAIPTEHTTVIRTEIRSAYVWDFLGLFRLRMRLTDRKTHMKTLSLRIAVLPHARPPKGKLRMWDNSQSTLIPTHARPSNTKSAPTGRAMHCARSTGS